MSDDIHDLFRKVQEHPDFVFGTIFVREDFPDPGCIPEAAYDMDGALSEAGNELISDLELEEDEE